MLRNTRFRPLTHQTYRGIEEQETDQESGPFGEFHLHTTPLAREMTSGVLQFRGDHIPFVSEVEIQSDCNHVPSIVKLFVDEGDISRLDFFQPDMPIRGIGRKMFVDKHL